MPTLLTVQNRFNDTHFDASNPDFLILVVTFGAGLIAQESGQPLKVEWLQASNARRLSATILVGGSVISHWRIEFLTAEQDQLKDAWGWLRPIDRTSAALDLLEALATAAGVDLTVLTYVNETIYALYSELSESRGNLAAFDWTKCFIPTGEAV